MKIMALLLILITANLAYAGCNDLPYLSRDLNETINNLTRLKEERDSHLRRLQQNLGDLRDQLANYKGEFSTSDFLNVLNSIEYGKEIGNSMGNHLSGLLNKSFRREWKPGYESDDLVIIFLALSKVNKNDGHNVRELREFFIERMYETYSYGRPLLYPAFRRDLYIYLNQRFVEISEL